MAQVSDIGVDVGTSQVIYYMTGRGIVLREPAVVAYDRDQQRILAVGRDAHRLIGRTPGNVQALRPIRQGSALDYELMKEMLRTLTVEVIGRKIFGKPRAVISVPTVVSETEKRLLVGIMLDAGTRQARILDRPIAAALGIGLPFEEPYGTMLIDMEAGASDIAVLSLGEIVTHSCVPIGGDYFDDAIIRYLRKKHNLLIGERTAEEVKINIGSAVPPSEEVSMDVTGRNLVSGLPKTETILSSEIHEALMEPVSDLIDAIQSVIERTPPQLASDIFEYGIVLSGGAAKLSGLASALYQALEIACEVAPDPEIAVAKGCGRVLESRDAWRAYVSDTRPMPVWHR
ncbi:MAG: rod shape-determining protein [Clostridia bacterium]|nr:rod shape-determining protein [Clostridia bacterium]